MGEEEEIEEDESDEDFEVEVRFVTSHRVEKQHVCDTCFRRAFAAQQMAGTS